MEDTSKLQIDNTAEDEGPIDLQEPYNSITTSLDCQGIIETKQTALLNVRCSILLNSVLE